MSPSIEIEQVEPPKRKGVRKANLTRKQRERLWQFLRYALGAGRPLLSVWELEFLTAIEKDLRFRSSERLKTLERVAPTNRERSVFLRLSKKQRDKIAEIELQMARGEPVVYLEGEDLVTLRRFINFAQGDAHLTGSAENFLVTKLKPIMYEKVISLTQRQFQFYQTLQEQLKFDREGTPPEIDPDGIVENTDPDGYPMHHQYADGEAQNFQIIHYDDYD